MLDQFYMMVRQIESGEFSLDNFNVQHDLAEFSTMTGGVVAAYGPSLKVELMLSPGAVKSSPVVNVNANAPVYYPVTADEPRRNRKITADEAQRKYGRGPEPVEAPKAKPFGSREIDID